MSLSGWFKWRFALTLSPTLSRYTLSPKLKTGQPCDDDGSILALVLEPRDCRDRRYCRWWGKRLLARGTVDEQTLVPPAQTPGTAAKRSIWPPRVAHYVRKRF